MFFLEHKCVFNHLLICLWKPFHWLVELLSQEDDMMMGRSSPTQPIDDLSQDSPPPSLIGDDEDEGADYSELNPLDMMDVRDMLVRDRCVDTNSISSDSAVGSSLSTINSSASKTAGSVVSKVGSYIRVSAENRVALMINL